MTVFSQAAILSITEQTDIAYKRAFSRMEVRSWGMLFVNEANPMHYDANHAHVSQPVTGEAEAEAIVRETISFFSERGIIPRIYVYEQGDKEPLIAALERHGFQMESLPSPMQLWQGELAEARPMEGIVIEPVTAANYDDCLTVESIPELGGREVREKAFAREFAHPDFSHYLLRVNGEPASTLCLLRAGEYMRVENVATLPAFRGRGLIGHLLRHAQERFLEEGGSRLLVFPINDHVARLYRRYGFADVGEVRLLHAYRGGKGILEIR
ncbi:ribosomal protein S18 acetylase RimI-like enzyme [Brevibacillus aydinogluensis]|uniref:GNAT family N-acetyltransferase n=1 Tax=Brevibacillus aydinogluensis TaxID=927786 RepID=UPI0028935CD6|nr:GNAT family N-acetyltransferase [Brevibacillus aydinogluensis]MDT3417765.1 ribosomal protein S18 acetylase RimI-like enzyme [Brevibacillus aydinogluensis]